MMFAGDPDLRQELATAQQAARAAGEYLVQKLGDAQVRTYKAARDAQLDVDLGAEAILINAIHAAFPDDAILSEEADVAAQAASRRWIIDPLDGSFNFQHGQSHFGIAIAFQLDGATKVGALYLPRADELYTTIQGQGTFCNDAAIHASQTASLHEAIIYASDFASTGNPDDNRQQLRIMTALAQHAGRIRMIGTAVDDFASLARGRSDGLVMYSLWPWDIEAGKLLVEEAGGIVTRESLPDGKAVYVGGNQHLHQTLVAIVTNRQD